MDFAVAIAAVCFAAFAFYPALRLNRGGQTLGCLLSSLAVGLAPTLVPVEFGALRLAASLVSVGTLVKLYDVFRNPALARQHGWRFYAAYLPNWCWLVLRRVPAMRDGRDDFRRLAQRAALAIAGLALAACVFRVDWTRLPFVLEHVAKVCALYAVIVPAAGAAAAGIRLLGGRALDPMESPATDSTPAEFWRRWNRPAQQFLDTYVFRPAGGRHRPFRATLLTFAVSAVVHEYLFSIAAARVLGWQVAFFLLQGIAVATTWRYRPVGRNRFAGIVLTLTFNLATSVLFFRSVDAVLPFYVPRV